MGLMQIRDNIIGLLNPLRGWPILIKYFGQYGRSKKRIFYSFILIIFILAIFLYSGSKSLAGILTIALPAFLAYIFYLDQKRIEKIAEYKFNIYIETIRVVAFYYRIPALFINGDASKIEELKNTIPQDNLSSAMILISNDHAYIAMSRLSRMILEKTLSLILLLEKDLNFKNAKRKSIQEFYRILDKSKLSLKSKNEIEQIDSLDYPVIKKFALMAEALITIKEINRLTIDLANEMRKDLEMDEISEDQKVTMIQSLDESVDKLFEFLQSLIKQIGEGIVPDT